MRKYIFASLLLSVAACGQYGPNTWQDTDVQVPAPASDVDGGFDGGPWRVCDADGGNCHALRDCPAPDSPCFDQPVGGRQ